MGFLQPLWDGLVGLFDWFAAVLIDVIAFFTVLMIDMSFAATYAFIAFLPDMPEADHTGIQGFDGLGFANNYVPISEILALLPLLGVIFGAIGIYKLIKFLSPISA